MSGHWCPSHDVWSGRIGDQLVLLSLQTGAYVTLNATATAIWSALASGRTEVMVAGQLAESFGIAIADAEVDVAEIVSDLSRRRMLVDALNAPKSTHPAVETHDSHRAPLVPSTIGCAAELLRVHALLRMYGAATLIAASRNLDLQMRVRALSLTSGGN